MPPRQFCKTSTAPTTNCSPSHPSDIKPNQTYPASFTFNDHIRDLLRSCKDKLDNSDFCPPSKSDANYFAALHAPIRVAMLEAQELATWYPRKKNEGSATQTDATSPQANTPPKYRNKKEKSFVEKELESLYLHIARVLRTERGRLNKDIFLNGLETLTHPKSNKDRLALELKTLVIHGLTVCEFNSLSESLSDLMEVYRAKNTSSDSKRRTLRAVAFDLLKSGNECIKNIVKRYNLEGAELKLTQVPDQNKKDVNSTPENNNQNTNDEPTQPADQESHKIHVPLLDHLGRHEHTRWIAGKWLSGKTDHECLTNDSELPYIMRCLDQVQVASFAAYELIKSTEDFMRKQSL